MSENVQKKELLTHSRAQSFKACRRQHWYAYELKLRPLSDARALRMGDAFDKGVERLPDLESACAAVRSRYAYCPQGWELRDWEIERETILRLVCGYQWRWANAGLEIVAVQRSFAIPLLNPDTGAEAKFFDLAGKTDAIVRLEDGRLAVKETKTCGEDIGPDSDYWRTLRIDSQISLYINAARREGFDVSTVLYDVCRKPSIAPENVPILDQNGKKIVLDANGKRVCNTSNKEWRQTADKEKGYVLQTRPMTSEEWGDKLSADIAARPDFYYARVEVPRLDGDIEEFNGEMWQVQQSLREAQRTGKHYRTVTRNCKFCPYFNICSEGRDVSKVAPEGFTFVSNPHPELNLEEIHNVQSTECTAETSAASAAPAETVGAAN
jgi:PD-(D/E)XK nuclease superfamily